MSLLRQLNVLHKYGGRGINSFPRKVKLFETSKRKPAVCAVFIVSSSHQYSTLYNRETLNHTNLLLDRRLLAANIVSYGLLSTDDTNKVQNLLADTVSSRNYYATSEVSGGSATVSPSGGSATVSSSSDAAVDLSLNSTGLPASDHVESVLPSGDLSENLAHAIPDAASILDSAEVPLSALGLAKWTPVGLVQWCIELLHVNFDMPWWGAIVTATFIARALLLPLMVKGQKIAIELSNHMPQLQVLQQKFHKARCSGDSLQAYKYGIEMRMFMQKHKVNPMKSFIVPLFQAPVFISFFLGLRSMANLPVESLKTGGLLWITDLTIADPYYIIPILTCGTLYIILKVGAEGGMKLDHMKIGKYVLTALPVILIPVTARFPAAVLCYWFANNVFTLGAVSLLRIESVRKAFKIPKRKQVDPEHVLPKKRFIEGIKEAYQDQKVLGALADRERIDAVRFQKAGSGPVPRTYSYDPTKPRPLAAAAARKAKEYKP